MNRVKFFKMLAAAAVVGGVAVFGVVGCADKSPASQNREKLSTGTDNVCESEAGCPDYDTEQGTSTGDVAPGYTGPYICDTPGSCPEQYPEGHPIFNSCNVSDNEVVSVKIYDDLADDILIGMYSVQCGRKLPKPADPIHEGYTFMGWHAQTLGPIKPFMWDFDTDTIAHTHWDIVIFAYYEMDGALPPPKEPELPEEPNVVPPSYGDDGPLYGKWRLVEVSILKDNDYPAEKIDYSAKDMIYVFMNNNRFYVVGMPDSLFVFDNFKRGQDNYYEYYEPNVCPTCTPGPNLFVNSSILDKSVDTRNKYFANLNGDTLTIVGDKYVGQVVGDDTVKAGIINHYHWGKTLIKL
jgi:hypothetical protein